MATDNLASKINIGDLKDSDTGAKEIEDIDDNKLFESYEPVEKQDDLNEDAQFNVPEVIPEL